MCLAKYSIYILKYKFSKFVREHLLEIVLPEKNLNSILVIEPQTINGVLQFRKKKLHKKLFIGFCVIPNLKSQEHVKIMSIKIKPSVFVFFSNDSKTTLFEILSANLIYTIDDIF